VIEISNTCKGRKITDVVVKNKLTADNKKFLIHDDGKKQNFSFCFANGFKISI
jgi:hypothetical protein